MIIKPKGGMWKGIFRHMGLSFADTAVSAAGPVALELYFNGENFGYEMYQDPQTRSISPDSYTNSLLVVFIAIESSITVTSVAFNSEALTQHAAETNGTSRAEIWYKVSPANGSSLTLAYDFSDVPSGSGGYAFFSGVDQSTPLGTVVSETDNSIDITVPANGGAVDFMATTGLTGNSPTQTKLIDRSSLTIAGAASLSVTGGSQTFTWTGATGTIRHIGVPINPA